MKNKTTARHFAIFRAECEKWIEIFGLKGWEVHIVHEEIKDRATRANCYYNTAGKFCKIRLSKHWESVELNDYQIRKYAFHEVCELFLGELVSLAEYRYATPYGIEEQTHAIIRTLENVLWNENNNK